MKIFVGNLASDVTADELRQQFSAFGAVESADIITDRQSGRSKGFGFIEMKSKDEAEAAIAGLKGKILKERTLDISEVNPRPNNRSGGSYNKKGGGRNRRR